MQQPNQNDSLEIEPITDRPTIEANNDLSSGRSNALKYENKRCDESWIAVELQVAHSGAIRLSNGQSIILGRHAESPISILRDPSASRRHCRIECIERKVLLHDLGSTNGTYCNGVPIDSVQLCDGDQIVVGKTIIWVRLIYVDP